VFADNQLRQPAESHRSPQHFALTRAKWIAPTKEIMKRQEFPKTEFSNGINMKHPKCKKIDKYSLKIHKGEKHEHK